jgi:hypothetical protein
MTELTDYEIHEVTTSASLSTGTSPTTESIVSLNLGINPGKYEHPCQVKDLNPAGQVLSTKYGRQFTKGYARGSR